MLRYTIPIWLAMIVNTLLGITDTIILSTINKDYISYLGIAYIPFTLISTLIIGIGIESNKYNSQNKSFNFYKILMYTILTSLLLSLLFFFLRDNILFWAKSKSHYEFIQTYFSIIIFSLAPTAVLFLCTGLFRGRNKSRITLYFSIFCVILNAIFDIILVSFLSNALYAVAIATLLADTLTALIYIYATSKQKDISSNEMNAWTFLKSAFKNSIEKFLSSGTLELISVIFIVKLSITESNIYFLLDKLFLPFQMFSFAYMEWVLFTEGKNMKRSISIFPLYFIILLIYGVFVTYISFDNITSYIYLSLLCIYFLFFLLQRNIVGKFLVYDYQNTVNFVTLLRNITLIIILYTLVITHLFSLVTYMFVSLILLLSENIILSTMFKKKKIFNLKIDN
ncbi:polysaccharide biosynthesis C-terminal domain-containing protein [Staphylococcus saprophyticus]|uniref:MATE family efflux transporter n=1 Tax=Staphylococcus saprophyticus TaxID=29385 RepID=UPI00188877F1|nr:MATE family efflux transporter [Staphylococcus saprophyticus]MBF2777747.1 polysaccharide biosynthesis C-terminal domain-containing protein [Staphylococcus saprophyticus]MBF2781607.1 polysaccharide biosynthesis C-terminal domain-containing protein [Staphylococcus saprophyticus]